MIVRNNKVVNNRSDMATENSEVYRIDSQEDIDIDKEISERSE